MNIDETLQVLMLVKTAYPNFLAKTTKQDSEALAKLWQRQFQDYDANLVVSAIDTIIATDLSDFAPTIARIKQVCHNLANPNQLSEVEVWESIKKAMRNATYGSIEEFSKLPEVAKQIVGSPQRLRDWSMMDSDELETVVYSNFSKVYKSTSEYDRQQMLIPTSTKERLRLEADEGLFE